MSIITIIIAKFIGRLNTRAIVKHEILLNSRTDFDGAVDPIRKGGK